MAISDNLARVREEMEDACRTAGRSVAEVTLVAVTKVHPVELMVEAYAAGQRVFGENRVQEFQAKASTARGLAGAEFHLIGPLQNNKTSKAVELFDAVDTLAELKTAERLGAAARALRRELPVLVEVKLSSEEAKHGVSPESLGSLLDAVAAVDGLRVRGLMTVPPWSEDAEAARPYFQSLRRLRDEHAARHKGLVELSMGMSNDFRVAIEEGSTSIRLGTALFGARPKRDAESEAG